MWNLYNQVKTIHSKALTDKGLLETPTTPKKRKYNYFALCITRKIHISFLCGFFKDIIT